MKRFRFWQSDDLADAYEKSAQICANIEEAVANTELKSVPQSIIPSDTLWLLATSIVDMYEKLLEHELLANASPSKQSNKLH